MRPRLKVNLSTWLAGLVLGAALPLGLLAWITFREISTSSQALLDQRQADTARALALAVEGEVHAWKAALAALAESRSIQPDRLAEFYEEARQVGLQHDGWVVLTVASGTQIFNTLLPYGAPLQKTSSPETINAIFREGTPIVSDLIWGKNAQRYLVAVAVPVRQGGKVVNCLTLNFSPDRLTRLLLRQQLPPSWVAAITDRQSRVVARSRDAESMAGKTAPAWYAAVARDAESGFATGPTLDGREARVTFQRLREVPWVVGLAAPTAELQTAAPLRRFILLSLLLGVAAVGAAVFTGRKILAPVSRLAKAGDRLLQGTSLDLGPSSGIREVGELQQTVAEAWAAINARDREREEAEARLRRLNVDLELRVKERTEALAAANAALQATNAALRDDIEQRTRAEDALQHTLAELQRSNQDLEHFAYAASHDLQEPLRMVTGFTQLLAQRYQDRLDQDAREFIGFAVDGATHMQRLIQDLLAYSRVTTRGADPKPTDAQAALQAALRNLHAAIQETAAVVTHDALPTVRVDGTQLIQVFQNLVGNALKFRGAAPPRIHVGATARDDVWVFGVEDNGIGIAPQYFERIFLLFQRLHTSDRYPGTGIGLALCKRVVERHGGRMWVESTPGKGATFYFTVKRAEETPA